ncbi:MAG: host-nuclease inhibitor Gam family protein [Lachnospiraceae bacterium]|nr:host-nuclease inhibitor Gam family protein [Lachnospiraceae bacterium]
MARKKVTEQVLTSWDEVNESLKIIGDAQNEIATIESEMNAQIAEIKKAAKEKVKSHESIIKINEVLIQQFATEHKGDLKGKSRKFAFGTLGFRLSTKLILPKQIKTVIENLKSNGMMDCLNTTITVNKEVLKTYDEKEIINVGGSLKKEDTFWYETEKTTVQDK